jgi:PilZ domain
MIERQMSQWIVRNRKAMSLTGVAYRSDGAWVRVHMTNLSYDGCHILTEEILDLGEALTIVMPRMRQIKAQVRWVKDGEAGVRFLNGANALDDRRARIGV